MRYGTIIYEIRDSLHLTNNEYLLLDAILKLQAGGKQPGWCSAGAAFLAAVVGVDRSNFFRMQARLIERGFLEVLPSGLRRVSQVIVNQMFPGDTLESSRETRLPENSRETRLEVVAKRDFSSRETRPDNTDNTDNNTVGTRARKNPAVGALKKKTPPVPAPPPGRGAALFADSPWTVVTPSEWDDAFRAAVPGLVNVDSAWYYARVRDWSATKGATSCDWVATARSFAEADLLNGKLVTKSISHAANRKPNTGAGPLPNPASTLSVAARVAQRRRASRGEQ
jgi:hypothetical protein